jgi:hypothetical protein
MRTTRPSDPFGFISRQKILEHDFPQNEISPSGDDHAAIVNRSPMVEKIMNKYGKGSKHYMGKIVTQN